jgi:hypothetical protein
MSKAQFNRVLADVTANDPWFTAGKDSTGKAAPSALQKVSIAAIINLID